MKNNIGIKMQIKIDYDNLDIPNFEGIIVDKKNYNIRQSKKFIKKLLEYDYNYLKEGNFKEDVYFTMFLITCINKYKKYEFLSFFNTKKLLKANDYEIRYIENGK